MSLLGGFDAVCDNYEIDQVKVDLSGNMCWGMGASPPCLHCGADEHEHFLAKQMRTPEYQEYERRRIERRKETKG